MSKFYRALGNFVVRFRYFVVAGWIAAAAFCLVALPSLSSVIKTQQDTFLPASSPSIKAQHLALQFNHQSQTLASMTFVATLPPAVAPGTSSDRIHTALSNYQEAEGAVTELEAKIGKMPHVRSVQDFGTAPDGGARQALILANVPITGGGTADTLIKNIRASFVSPPYGVQYHLTGDLAANYDIKQETDKAAMATQMLSYLVIIVLLLVAFRALLAPIVTLLAAGMALLISGPVVAEATHINVPVSVITELVIIVLILGAGTDYCVFLLSRMREEMRNGLTAKAAVARSVATVGETITFSAFTVMAALFALLLASFGIYQSLGPALGIGVAIMLLAGLTLFPSLLAIFGRAVFWPSQPQRARIAAEGRWFQVASRVISRPVMTLTFGIALLVALTLSGLGAPKTGGFASGEPSQSDSYAGQQALVAHFPGAGQYPEIAVLQFKKSLWNDPGAAANAQGFMASNPLFHTVAGPFGASPWLTAPQIANLYRILGPPASLPPTQPSTIKVKPLIYNGYRALAQYFTPDGRMVRYYATPLRSNVDNKAAIDGVPQLRGAVAKAGTAVGATNTALYGVLPVAYDISQTSDRDLSIVVPIVAVMIAILLAIVLRSLVAPLYLVASVVLSYLATIGLAGLVFVRLVGRPNVFFVIPLIVFIFLMALGSDYNILVMSRIREEARSLPLKEAVSRAIAATGTTVTTAGLILGGTFAVFGLAAPAGELGESSREIGYSIAAGILIDTFLVRTLLVPSMVVLSGRFNWWPWKLGHKSVGEQEAGPVIEQETVHVDQLVGAGRDRR